MVLKARYLVTLATLLALGLALHQLGHEPFWHDEFTTWRWASLPFAEIWSQASVRDYHPPLYFWFMHGWLRVVPPPDEFWLRLPSALFFALTVPPMYLVGRTLGGTPRAGVYAAFLAATFPSLLHFGQEARPYAMLTFFAACGFAGAAHLVSRCREEARPRLPGADLIEAARSAVRGDFRASMRPAPGDDGAWAVYIVSSSAVMWLHSTAGLFPAVTGLILLCAVAAAPSHRVLRFAGLSIAMALIAVLYSPQVPLLLSGVDRISLSYIDVPDARKVLRMFREVYGGRYVALIALTLLALVAMAARARRGRWEWVAFALLGWLLAPLILIAFSFWKPIVQNKLLIWTVIPFLAAAAAGLALVPWTVVRAAALAVLLALNLQGVAGVWEYAKFEWRDLSRTIEREAAPGAAVIICPAWYPRMFDHYWGGTRKDLRFHVVDIHSRRDRVFKVFEVAGHRPEGGRGPEVSPAGLAAHYPEVWLIWGWICKGKLGFLTKPLEGAGQSAGKWKFGTAHAGLYRKGE